MIRTIYSTGETVFDIILKDSVPKTGNPGGSVLNSAVTLGRLGLSPVFLSDFCDDLIGKVIADFLSQNGVRAQKIINDEGKKTSIALAFLDSQGNAQYEFYKQKPSENQTNFNVDFKEDDILLFGSFYGIMPEIRSSILRLLTLAKNNSAIIVYDPNFRKPHLKELPRVLPYIIENIRFSDIVKGSDEDFSLIFSTQNDEDTFEKLRQINPNAHLFYTKGKNGCSYSFKGKILRFEVPKIIPVSTIGAGDNFNAGIVAAVIRENITKKLLTSGLDKEMVSKIISLAVELSQEVCMSQSNYIAKRF